MAEQTETIEDLASALDALESYEPGRTKRALRFLVDGGEIHALPRILPLTQHPSPAMRFIAKRAVQELRALPPERLRVRPAPVSSEPAEIDSLTSERDREQEELPVAVGQVSRGLTSLDPRLEALLDAPVRRRPRRAAPGGVPMRWFDIEL